MSRSLWKGPYIKYKGNLNRKYMSRSSMILPSHVNKTFDVHNGKLAVKLMILPEMIGKKFGEFVLTKSKKHGSKN